MTSELIHATTVARHGAAVLLRGACGAGKSDLALRLIDRGWSLVSDDQSELSTQGDDLVGYWALLIDVPGVVEDFALAADIHNHVDAQRRERRSLQQGGDP